MLVFGAASASSGGSVSVSVRRSRRPNGTIAAPIRNAILHPQDSSCAVLRVDDRPKPISPAASDARSAVAKLNET